MTIVLEKLLLFTRFVVHWVTKTVVGIIELHGSYMGHKSCKSQNLNHKEHYLVSMWTGKGHTQKERECVYMYMYLFWAIATSTHAESKAYATEDK